MCREIIGFRPTLSKSGASMSGPHRLPTANASPYRGTLSADTP